MTPAAANLAIKGAINTAWVAGPNTPIAFPNVPFKPPAYPATWAKVDLVFGNGAHITKGVTDGRSSTAGVLQLAVFGPKDQGDGALDALAQTARALFNRKRLTSPSEDVVFGPASGPVRQFEESWRTIVVSFPFQVYETVT